MQRSGSAAAGMLSVGAVCRVRLANRDSKSGAHPPRRAAPLAPSSAAKRTGTPYEIPAAVTSAAHIAAARARTAGRWRGPGRHGIGVAPCRNTCHLPRPPAGSTRETGYAKCREERGGAETPSYEALGRPRCAGCQTETDLLRLLPNEAALLPKEAAAVIAKPSVQQRAANHPAAAAVECPARSRLSGFRAALPQGCRRARPPPRLSDSGSPQSPCMYHANAQVGGVVRTAWRRSHLRAQHSHDDARLDLADGQRGEVVGPREEIGSVFQLRGKGARLGTYQHTNGNFLID